MRARGTKCAALALALLALLSRPALSETSTVTIGVKNNMRAVLITPDGPGPYPAILVLHTSGGLQSADTEFAEHLVAQGYVALVPAFMDAYGITARTRRDTFTGDAAPIYADFVAALDMLSRHDKVKGGKLGAVGFSNGGYFAVWLAATNKVQAAVSYYGALTGAGSDGSLGRFREAFTKNSAPVLILHGTADGTVPVQAAQHLAEIVAAAQSPYQIQLYPGVDHRFDRDHSLAAEPAAADAWQRTLTFFGKYLH